MTIHYLNHPAITDDAAELDRLALERCTEPRLLTDHPGHATLREFWQAQPRPAAAAKTGGSDILGNHHRAVLIRAEKRNVHYNALSTEVWRLYAEGGKSWAVACKEVGIAEGTARRRCTLMGLKMVESVDTVERG